MDRPGSGGQPARRPTTVRTSGAGLPGPRRKPRHGHGGRRELLPAATLLPSAAAWQPSRTASSAASNGLLPCTESSLWVGCVVVARGERAVWASTCFVDGASWRGMASTYMMVPKDCSRSGRRRAAHLPAYQRARGMDGAAHVEGPSHGRALRTCSAARCDSCERVSSSMLASHEWVASAELVQPGSVRGAPRSDDGK